MVYTGNVISNGDSYNYEGQYVKTLDGRKIYRAVGAGILTDTLQTSIPVVVYPPRNKELAATFPNRNIVVPIGAQVLSVSLRLPSTRIKGDQIQWGAQIPIGCTIIGTSTDVLKVNWGTANGFAAAKTASIAAASSVYAIGASARLGRTPNTADDASGILNTVASTAKTVRLMVDNAANDAAGTGIRLSVAGETAAIAVDIIWAVTDDAVQYNELPNLTENFYIRS